MQPAEAGKSLRALSQLLALGLVMATAALSAALFLPHQSLWGDEAAQLYGLSLKPRDVTAWLVDARSQDTNFADRNPPLSYWLGWGWSQIFGRTETSLRSWGVVCTALAAGLVFRTAHKTYGLLPGLAVGMLFALSPNVCYRAVEVRTYPLFLLCSAGAVGAFVGLVEAGPRPFRTWVAFAVWLVLALYTHFFGLVLVGSLLLALLLIRLSPSAVEAGRPPAALGAERPEGEPPDATAKALQDPTLNRREGVRPVLAAGCVVALIGLGLLPFVQGAFRVEVPAGSTERVRDRPAEVARLLYRLVGHPALKVEPVAEAGALSSAALLLAAGFFPLTRGKFAVRGLRLHLVIGLAVMGLANFLLDALEAATPHYSTWALPGWFVLLGAGLVARSAALRRVAWVATVILLVSEAVGSAELWVRGDSFAHCSYRSVRAVLDELPPSQTAVVHEDGPGPWYLVYQALDYSSDGRLPQFVATGAGPGLRGGDRLQTSFPDVSILNQYRHVVVVRSQTLSGREIAEQIWHGGLAPGFGPFVSGLESSGAWRRTRHKWFVSLIAAEVLVLERVHDP